MAVLIEGLQGSGKSYYATYHMYHDSNKYYKIFTNIDGIKTTDKIIDLEFKKFVRDILDECYNLQVSNDGSFEESIDFLKTMHFLPHDVSKDNRVLIVVDEAQNYFGKSVKLEPSLVWFITQHRHLYIELYLITQKYTLLRPDYHLFNLVYKAYPPVKQFSKNKIRYMEYAGLPLNDDNLSKKFMLPKEQRVFDMYISGDKVTSPSILKKFLVYFVVLALIILALVYLFSKIFGNSDDIDTVSTQIDKVINSPSIKPKIDNSENELYTFVVWEDGYFHIREIEDNVEYPIRFLKYIKDNYFETVIEKVNMGQGMTIIYVICNNSLSSFLEKKEEKKGLNSMNSFVPM